MAQLVNPVEARKGVFLDSFPAPRGKNEMNPPEDVLLYCEEQEANLRRLGASGEIVYSRIPKWGKHRGDMWWVCLLQTVNAR